MLKFTIVTVCHNSEKFIRSAIDSVLNQNYNEIEYIIIDGASSDNTIDIIKSYGNKISHFISEIDAGIYHAMNKGISIATGDVVGILNSDDFYIHDRVIENIARQLEITKTDSIYADLIYVNPEYPEKQVRYWRSKPFVKGSFSKGWHPPHPTFFVKREIYQKYSLFNLKFKLAADFELMIRFLEKHGITTYYFPEPIIKMRLGGATNKSISNIIKQNIECYKAFKTNGIPVSLMYPVYRLLPKLKQFFTNPGF